MILYKRIKVEISILRRSYTPPDEGPNLPTTLAMRDDVGETIGYTTWWVAQKERVVIDRMLQVTRDA